MTHMVELFIYLEQIADKKVIMKRILHSFIDDDLFATLDSSPLTFLSL